jgi:hypothetical protein
MTTQFDLWAGERGWRGLIRTQRLCILGEYKGVWYLKSCEEGALYGFPIRRMG